MKTRRLDELKEQLRQKREGIAQLNRALTAAEEGAPSEEIEALEHGKETPEEKELREKREEGKLRKCKVCRTEFEPIKPNQVFCSALCRTLYWKAYRSIEAGEPVDYKTSVKCRTCETPFIPSGNRRVFCSESCAIAYSVKQSMQANKTPLFKLRFEVFMRDNFRCRYCGRSPLVEPEVTLVTDHMIPTSQGGKAELTNLVTSCFECNIGKKDVLLEEHIMRTIVKRTIDT